MFENRVLRRIFGPKKDQVTGEWRKLHNEELNDLYFIFLSARQPPVGQGLLIHEVARSHTTTHHSR